MEQRALARSTKTMLALAWLVVVVGLAGLGGWQLERAESKERVLATHRGAAQQPAVDLNAVLERGVALDAEALKFRAAVVRGSWVANRSFLLDNRRHDGRLGFEVLSPVAVDGTGSWVLVNRGWIPAAGYSETGRVLPNPTPPPVGATTLSGELVVPPGGLFVDAVTRQGLSAALPWPRLAQYVDLTVMSELLSRPLLPLVLRLDPQQPGGFTRDWVVIASGVRPGRHVAYAFQWFALAATAALIPPILWLRQRRYRR